MAKIDIVQHQLQHVEQNVLDIYELQMISLYEALINQKNITEYLLAVRGSGYLLGVEIMENGKMRFSSCDPDHIARSCEKNIHRHFDILPWFARKMLTDWHNKTLITPRSRYFGRNETVIAPLSIELTHQQRGVLTKILKIEKKRKKAVVTLR